MHHAGSRGGTGGPEQAQAGRKGPFLAKGLQLLHPRQQVGLLLLHQHRPAQGLLESAGAAVALAAG